MRPIASTLFIASLLVAGCSDPGDEETPPPHSESYDLRVANLPTTVAANASFMLDLFATGEDSHASDHIGAHFGNATTSTPSTTVYAVTCQHQAGTLPGEFQVTCKAPTEAGIYFLRGHARIIQDNTTVQWWSAEHAFTVT